MLSTECVFVFLCDYGNIKPIIYLDSVVYEVGTEILSMI
jgi:hypothetical protein